MSGTSADGIDAALAELTENGGRIRAVLRSHASLRFSAALRERIHRICTRGLVWEICELNFELGEKFATAALRVLAKAGVDPADVLAIGSHGQTIHHLPGATFPSTLQIGEPAVIAERTGITTVGDFRGRDMAAGGQGAPLVPFADIVLFSHERRPRLVQNIGGVANVTLLPGGARTEGVIAFDTGPGNMIIDGVMTMLSSGRLTYDRDGRRARRGKVHQGLLREWLGHPFMRRRPPKTTGREEFGEQAVKRFIRRGRALRMQPDDLVATATALTAACISDAYRRFVFPQLAPAELADLEVILGGGGAKNQTLKRMLQEELPMVRLRSHEDYGVPNQAKEALAFAILAYETLMGRPGNVQGATGASHAVVLGKIVPGKSFTAARAPASLRGTRASCRDQCGAPGGL